VRKTRRKLVYDKRAGNEKQPRGNNPQANRRSAVVARRREPARAQHGGDVEEQNVPKTEDTPELLFCVRSRGGAHPPALVARVTSSAGINSSCKRKLRINGSCESSNSCHVPKKVTRPSCKKIIRSASLRARCVSCVTTMEVLWNFSFNLRI